ncbi:MAG: aminopeptidase P family protein [Anaerolineae bacterium]|nr:aminopeptidase P family protein [Anaerolineae bacterium]
MTINYAARLARARARMEELGIGLLYLPQSANLQWLLGIERHVPGFTYTVYPGGWLNGAFIGLDKGPILTVPRMVADFDLGNIPGLDMRVLPDRGDPAELVRGVLKDFNLQGQKVAVEDRAWASFVVNFQRLLPGTQLALASEVFYPLRQIKDEQEIALMRKAGDIVDKTMAEALKKTKPGITELELLTEVEYQMTLHGSDAPSFPTALYIINPRYDKTGFATKGRVDRAIEPGTSVPFDFGAVYEGYCSDFGRTVWIGEPPAEYLRTHELVMASQAAGIAAMRSGKITAAQLDAVARQVIDDAGYGAGFRHRLGHGIGMDVHEPAFLNTGDDTLLTNGMCFTIEPSIILDDRWMVRVEDVVVVRDTGGEPLSHYSKQPLVVA